jgi:hypothetical protein
VIAAAAIVPCLLLLRAERRARAEHPQQIERDEELAAETAVAA